MKRQILRRVEQFEDRICLAVSATISAGDLVVTGTPDGAVEILAVDEDTYQVSDNGVVITTLDGVSDDIRIALKPTASGGNDVTVNLAGQAVDSIMASLGNGTNSFTVEGGSANSLRYIGGSGGDTVELAETFSLESASNFCGPVAGISLGSGDNNLVVAAQVAGSLGVVAGSGADKVTVTDTASIAGILAAMLGSGDNSLDVNADITGALDVKAGDGNDTVTISEIGSVGNVALNLGAGDNTFTLLGSVTGGLNYQGGAGNDTLDIGDAVLIGGTARIGLGAGDNTVTLNGSVGGDFLVRSGNAEDVITIADTAVVSGTTDVQPGVETFPRLSRGPFGGRHAGPFGRR